MNNDATSLSSPTSNGHKDAFNSTIARSPRGGISFRWERGSGFVYIILDFACWLVIYQLVGYLRQSTDYQANPLFSSVALTQFGALLLALFVIGGYDRRTNFVSLGYMSEHLITIVAAGCLGAVTIYAGAAYAEAVRPSRSVLLASLTLFGPISLFYRRGIHFRLRLGLAENFYIVLGAGGLAKSFYRAYRSSSSQQRVRVVDPLPGAPRAGTSIDPDFADAPVIESISADNMALLIANSHGVIVAENKEELSPAVIQWLTRMHFADTPVYTLNAFFEKHWRIVPVHALDFMWPLEASSQLASQSIYAHIKRLLDVVISSLAISVLSPIFALLTLLTWLDSGRPALFRQTRIGRDGEPFTIYKFRTMHSRPLEAQGELYTQKGDPRVTRLGGWLRKLRLDELPQFWNVLKGDMSLMGPRAEWNRLAHQYEQEIPFYHFRHLVKPGITGWAQVNYPYGASKEDAVEKLKYDLYYIRHCSLRLDAMIVLKTLHIMLWGKGH